MTNCLRYLTKNDRKELTDLAGKIRSDDGISDIKYSLIKAAELIIERLDYEESQLDKHQANADGVETDNKTAKNPPTASNNDQGLQKPESPVTDNSKPDEAATPENVKQNEPNGKEDQSNDLSNLFKSFGKQGFKKGTESQIDGNPKADLIRNIQNHWTDILMDHGFEQDKPNGLKGKLSQSILMNGC